MDRWRVGVTIMNRDSSRLRHQPGGKKRESGISVLDLVNLPANQRAIMRVLLRKTGMTYSDLCDAVEAMPEVDRMARSELDEALKILDEQDWLITTSDQSVIYKANIRRKAGSKLQNDIWSALDPKTKQSKTTEKSD